MSALGLIGRKCGMTRVFMPTGESVPVSVIAVIANRVTQIKKKDGSDGYDALQITEGTRRLPRVNKALQGHYAKAKVTPGTLLKEFRGVLKDIEAGTELKVDSFQEGEWVDIAGVSKGKGFQGTVKRHHFTMGDATHGNSVSHRKPGSIGQRQTPGRVFKGKKLPGHMGHVNTTTQNLRVIRVDAKKGILFVKGSIPGAPGGHVFIYPSVKKQKKGGKHAN